MSERKLLKGNEAICWGAIDAGCQAFFGYPITPQNEVPEYLSELMPKHGRAFVQAESEVSSINMVYGAAGAGVRVMTSSSSPGISLMQEGISYIAGAELPAVIINVVRGGPGLGNIATAQSDYFQATRGGGHGDYRTPVLAPNSVQELYDFTRDAFDLADTYRTPVMVLADAILGQMMEAVSLDRPPLKPKDAPDWAATGTKNHPNSARAVINSLYIDSAILEEVNFKLEEKYKQIAKNELRYEENIPEDADVLLVAYGTSSRVCQTAAEILNAEGIKTGLFRPITLYPFPYEQLNKAADKAKQIFSVELSMGQMIDDIKIAVAGKRDVNFYGRTGGVLFTPHDVVNAVKAKL